MEITADSPFYQYFYRGKMVNIYNICLIEHDDQWQMEIEIAEADNCLDRTKLSKVLNPNRDIRFARLLNDYKIFVVMHGNNEFRFLWHKAAMTIYKTIIEHLDKK